MPTYEYACRSCGSHLEVVQAFSDEPLTECSACGGPLRKVFGSIGISFKGSGFYKTDSRSSAKGGSEAQRDKDKERSGSEKAEKSEKSEKAEKKTEKSDTGAKADKPAGDKGGSGAKPDSKRTAKESTAAKSA